MLMMLLERLKQTRYDITITTPAATTVAAAAACPITSVALFLQTALPVQSPVKGKIVELLVEDGTTVNPGMALVKIEVGAGGSSKSESAESSEEKKKEKTLEEGKAEDKQTEKPSKQKQEQQSSSDKGEIPKDVPKTSAPSSKPQTSKPTSEVKPRQASTAQSADSGGPKPGSRNEERVCLLVLLSYTCTCYTG